MKHPIIPQLLLIFALILPIHTPGQTPASETSAALCFPPEMPVRVRVDLTPGIPGQEDVTVPPDFLIEQAFAVVSALGLHPVAADAPASASLSIRGSLGSSAGQNKAPFTVRDRIFLTLEDARGHQYSTQPLQIVGASATSITEAHIRALETHAREGTLSQLIRKTFTEYCATMPGPGQVLSLSILYEISSPMLMPSALDLKAVLSQPPFKLDESTIEDKGGATVYQYKVSTPLLPKEVAAKLKTDFLILNGLEREYEITAEPKLKVVLMLPTEVQTK